MKHHFLHSFLITLVIINATLLWVPAPAFSQSEMTLPEIERNLNATYQKISENGYPSTSDSIESYNRAFQQKIFYYMTHYPATITFPFDSLQKSHDIIIASSDDKLFRIYSWDRYDGGTMHIFDNLFQYKSGRKVYVKQGPAHGKDPNFIPGEFYSRIFTLKAKGKIYYLAIGNGIYSTKDASQSVEIFTIENHSLIDSVKLIRTKDGFVNSLSIGFDFFSVLNHPERPLRLIKYDTSKKIIYIPVVDDNENVTNLYLLYQFNGKYFQLIKPQKPNP